MMKNKVMTIHDEDEHGRTISMNAAGYGCYELVQFCINAGANLQRTEAVMKKILWIMQKTVDIVMLNNW